MAKKSTQPQSFEDAIGELERILAEMERGEVPLEESLVRYERGNALIQYCRGVLGRAEQQIEKLQNPDGTPASPTTNAIDPDADE
ncbi:MAG TPA: exodeoxyribonuclease VII small subunit [Tepidisphaeraceae bacterium]|jgi:exodeoxyribonuclease VII small subunit